MKNLKQKNLEEVKLEDLGLYIRTISIDYKPKNNKKMAELISDHFSVICTEENIEHYNILYEHHEELVQHHEDFELESRRESYFKSQGVSNPFY